eukprot:gnl/Chilomastix_cuspidata/3382.p1 GENE.gnl/Chilomastix_cuspidata/3382~~gnl/Chilomastix_cuspidata/3382.p1  ORF type:complete len:3658 (-),score=438.55 gnl/Chilomastix_cuspidata/3382:1711-12684(-)
MSFVPTDSLEILGLLLERKTKLYQLETKEIEETINTLFNIVKFIRKTATQDKTTHFDWFKRWIESRHLYNCVGFILNENYDSRKEKNFLFLDSCVFTLFRETVSLAKTRLAMGFFDDTLIETVVAFLTESPLTVGAKPLHFLDRNKSPGAANFFASESKRTRPPLRTTAPPSTPNRPRPIISSVKQSQQTIIGLLELFMELGMELCIAQSFLLDVDHEVTSFPTPRASPFGEVAGDDFFPPETPSDLENAESSEVELRNSTSSSGPAFFSMRSPISFRFLCVLSRPFFLLRKHICFEKQTGAFLNFLAFYKHVLDLETSGSVFLKWSDIEAVSFMDLHLLYERLKFIEFLDNGISTIGISTGQRSQTAASANRSVLSDYEFSSPMSRNPSGTLLPTRSYRMLASSGSKTVLYPSTSQLGEQIEDAKTPDGLRPSQLLIKFARFCFLEAESKHLQDTMLTFLNFFIKKTSTLPSLNIRPFSSPFNPANIRSRSTLRVSSSIQKPGSTHVRYRSMLEKFDTSQRHVRRLHEPEPQDDKLDDLIPFFMPNELFNRFFSSVVPVEILRNIRALARAMVPYCTNQLTVLLSLISRCLFTSSSPRNTNKPFRQVPSQLLLSASHSIFLNERDEAVMIDLQLTLFEQIAPLLSNSTVFVLIAIVMDLLSDSNNINESLIRISGILLIRAPTLFGITKKAEFFRNNDFTEKINDANIGVINMFTTPTQVTHTPFTELTPKLNHTLSYLRTLVTILEKLHKKPSMHNTLDDLIESFLRVVFRVITFADFGASKLLRSSPGGYFPLAYWEQMGKQFEEGERPPYSLVSPTPLIGVFNRTELFYFLDEMIIQQNHSFSETDLSNFQRANDCLLSYAVEAMPTRSDDPNCSKCHPIPLMDCLHILLFPEETERSRKEQYFAKVVEMFKKYKEKESVCFSIMLSLFRFLSQLRLAIETPDVQKKEQRANHSLQLGALHSPSYSAPRPQADVQITSVLVTDSFYTFEGVPIETSVRSRLKLFFDIVDTFSPHLSSDMEIKTFMSCCTHFGTLSAIVCNIFWELFSARSLETRKNSFSLLFYKAFLNLPLEPSPPQSLATSARFQVAESLGKLITIRENDADKELFSEFSAESSVPVSMNMISQNLVRVLFGCFVSYALSTKKVVANFPPSLLLKRTEHLQKGFATKNVYEESSSSSDKASPFYAEKRDTIYTYYEFSEFLQFKTTAFNLVPKLIYMVGLPSSYNALSQKVSPHFNSFFISPLGRMEVFGIIRCIIIQGSFDLFFLRNNEPRSLTEPLKHINDHLKREFKQAQSCVKYIQGPRLENIRKGLTEKKVFSSDAGFLLLSEFYLRSITTLYSLLSLANQSAKQFGPAPSMKKVFLTGQISPPDILKHLKSSSFSLITIKKDTVAIVDPQSQVYVFIKETKILEEFILKFSTLLDFNSNLSFLYELLGRIFKCSADEFVLEFETGPILTFSSAKHMRMSSITRLNLSGTECTISDLRDHNFHAVETYGAPPNTPVIKLVVHYQKLKSHLQNNIMSFSKQLMSAPTPVPRVLYNKNVLSKKSIVAPIFGIHSKNMQNSAYRLAFSLAVVPFLAPAAFRLLMTLPLDPFLVNDINEVSSLKEIRTMLLFSVDLEPPEGIETSRISRMSIAHYSPSVLLLLYMSRILLLHVRKVRKFCTISPQNSLALYSSPEKANECPGKAFFGDPETGIYIAILLFEIVECIIQPSVDMREHLMNHFETDTQPLSLLEQLFETIFAFLELSLEIKSGRMQTFSDNTRFDPELIQKRSEKQRMTVLLELAQHLISPKFLNLWIGQTFPLDRLDNYIRSVVQNASQNKYPEDNDNFLTTKLHLVMRSCIRSMGTRDRHVLFKDILDITVETNTIPVSYFAEPLIQIVRATPGEEIRKTCLEVLLRPVQEAVSEIVNLSSLGDTIPHQSYFAEFEEQLSIVTAILTDSTPAADNLMDVLSAYKTIAIEIVSVFSSDWDTEFFYRPDFDRSGINVLDPSSDLSMRQTLCESMTGVIEKFLGLLETLAFVIPFDLKEATIFLENLMDFCAQYVLPRTTRLQAIKTASIINRQFVKQCGFFKVFLNYLWNTAPLDYFTSNVRAVLNAQSMLRNEQEKSDVSSLFPTLGFSFTQSIRSPRFGVNTTSLDSMFPIIPPLIQFFANCSPLQSLIENLSLSASRDVTPLAVSLMKVLLLTSQQKNISICPGEIDAALFKRLSVLTDQPNADRDDIRSAHPALFVHTFLSTLLSDITKIELHVSAKHGITHTMHADFVCSTHQLVLNPCVSMQVALKRFLEPQNTVVPDRKSKTKKFIVRRSFRVLPIILSVSFEENPMIRDELREIIPFESIEGGGWNSCVESDELEFSGLTATMFKAELELRLQDHDESRTYVLLGGVWQHRSDPDEFITLTMADGHCELSDMKHSFVVSGSNTQYFLDRLCAYFVPVTLLYVDMERFEIICNQHWKERQTLLSSFSQETPTMDFASRSYIEMQTQNVFNFLSMKEVLDELKAELPTPLTQEALTFFIYYFIAVFPLSQLVVPDQIMALITNKFLPPSSGQTVSLDLSEIYPPLLVASSEHPDWLDAVCSFITRDSERSMPLLDFLQVLRTNLLAVSLKWPMLGIKELPPISNQDEFLDLTNEAYGGIFDAFLMMVVSKSHCLYFVAPLLAAVLSMSAQTLKHHCFAEDFCCFLLITSRWLSDAEIFLQGYLWGTINAIVEASKEKFLEIFLEAGWVSFTQEALRALLIEGLNGREPDPGVVFARLPRTRQREPLFCLHSVCFTMLKTLCLMILSQKDREQCSVAHDIFMPLLDEFFWDMIATNNLFHYDDGQVALLTEIVSAQFPSPLDKLPEMILAAVQTHMFDPVVPLKNATGTFLLEWRKGNNEIVFTETNLCCSVVASTIVGQRHTIGTADFMERIVKKMITNMSDSSALSVLLTRSMTVSLVHTQRFNLDNSVLLPLCVLYCDSLRKTACKYLLDLCLLLFSFESPVRKAALATIYLLSRPEPPLIPTSGGLSMLELAKVYFFNTKVSQKLLDANEVLEIVLSLPRSLEHLVELFSSNSFVEIAPHRVEDRFCFTEYLTLATSLISRSTAPRMAPLFRLVAERILPSAKVASYGIDGNVLAALQFVNTLFESTGVDSRDAFCPQLVYKVCCEAAETSCAFSPAEKAYVEQANELVSLLACLLKRGAEFLESCDRVLAQKLYIFLSRSGVFWWTVQTFGLQAAPLFPNVSTALCSVAARAQLAAPNFLLLFGSRTSTGKSVRHGAANFSILVRGIGTTIGQPHAAALLLQLLERVICVVIPRLLHELRYPALADVLQFVLALFREAGARGYPYRNGDEVTDLELLPDSFFKHFPFRRLLAGIALPRFVGTFAHLFGRFPGGETELDRLIRSLHLTAAEMCKVVGWPALRGLNDLLRLLPPVELFHSLLRSPSEPAPALRIRAFLEEDILQAYGECFDVFLREARAAGGSGAAMQPLVVRLFPYAAAWGLRCVANYRVVVSHIATLLQLFAARAASPDEARNFAETLFVFAVLSPRLVGEGSYMLSPFIHRTYALFGGHLRGAHVAFLADEVLHFLERAASAETSAEGIEFALRSAVLLLGVLVNTFTDDRRKLVAFRRAQAEIDRARRALGAMARGATAGRFRNVAQELNELERLVRSLAA